MSFHLCLSASFLKLRFQLMQILARITPKLYVILRDACGIYLSIIGDVNLEHLIKVGSVRFPHCPVTFVLFIVVCFVNALGHYKQALLLIRR